MHPNDEADAVYESVKPVVDDWILVHVVLLLMLPPPGGSMRCGPGRPIVATTGGESTA
jgi:hypothetical protein